jgi:leucyl aminopeptidase
MKANRPEIGALSEVDKRTGGVVTSLIETGEFTGKSCESAYLHSPGDIKAKRILLMGVGKQADVNADTVRRIAGAATRILRGKKVRRFAFLRRSQLPLGEAAQAAVEGALLSLFEPDKYHTSDKTESHLEEMILATTEGDTEELRRGIERGRIIAEATNFGRE